MMNTRTIALLAATLLSAAACDNHDSGTDGGSITVDVVRPDVVAATDAPAATDVVAAQDVVTPTDAVTATDASADAATDAATDGPGMYVDGCFVGTPVAMTDFLNRCTAAVGIPARAARGSRLLADGGVQPLSM